MLNPSVHLCEISKRISRLAVDIRDMDKGSHLSDNLENYLWDLVVEGMRVQRELEP